MSFCWFCFIDIDGNKSISDYVCYDSDYRDSKYYFFYFEFISDVFLKWNEEESDVRFNFCNCFDLMCR